MAFNIKDKSLSQTLERHLAKAQAQTSDALEKLASGNVFTRNDPRPADRAISDSLEFKLRSLTSSKRNISSAVGLLQTAESGLNEITNMILRMKEINVSAANTTVSDRERKSLFIEYEALHDEINRIAITTDYSGIPLLNGEDPKALEGLIFRVGDATRTPENLTDEDDLDINLIRFRGLKSVVATTTGLGIRSARELLLETSEESGLTLEDVTDLMIPEDEDLFSSVYDQALNTLATQRAVFGGMQSRLQKMSEYLDVYQENIAAAKSNITDVDYAKEVSKLIESKILTQAATASLAQGQISSQLALNLINSVL